MYLKAMVIIYKTIMLAALAKAIAGLAQYVVNKTSYCIRLTSMSISKIT